MNKLARSKLAWAGHVEMMGENKWQRNQMPQNGGEKDVRKSDIAMGGCIKGDIERIREERRKSKR